jgi:D-arabinose 1-dehydrogenase-like Zn-dependent alcohol dehydrogenase
MCAEAKPLAVSPLDLIMKRIKIIGSQQNGREYLFEALALAAAGKVRVVTETYRLDEIGKAYERVEKGQVRFRAVVVM